MHDLTLLRDLDADVAPPEPLTVLRARRRLLAAATPPRRRRSTRRTRVLALGAAASVVAGGVVVGGAFWHHDGRVLASADAVEVLGRAADATLATSDPVVGPGQYLEITTHAVDGNGSIADRDHGYFLSDTTYTTWVPADPDRVWTRRSSPREFLRWVARGSDGPAPHPHRAVLQRAPRGEFGGPSGDSWSSPTPAFLASLPRDPDALLAQLYVDESGGFGAAPDDQSFSDIADVLRSGLVHADLRAALFRAAQGIPGLTVTDAVNLDGHAGIAISRVSGITREDLVFDRETGLFIGEQSVTTTDVGEVPAGTTLESTAISTHVVDADQVP